jgi:two-component system response regulator GlrR
VKLLRVLQENAIRPIGSTDPAPGQRARDLGHAPRHPSSCSPAGKFREDLYYRLNVVHIEMPPLRAAARTSRCWSRISWRRSPSETGVRKIYAPEAVELLATADWPGNVRQLRTSCGRTSRFRRPRSSRLSWCSSRSAAPRGRLPSFDEARDEFTRSYLSQILQITGGNVSQAARLAKRNRTDFYKLLGRHQLTPEDFKHRLRAEPQELQQLRGQVERDIAQRLRLAIAPHPHPTLFVDEQEQRQQRQQRHHHDEHGSADRPDDVPIQYAHG